MMFAKILFNIFVSSKKNLNTTECKKKGFKK